MPEFEVPKSDMENARLGVVYLLSKLQVQASWPTVAKQIYRVAEGGRAKQDRDGCGKRSSQNERGNSCKSTCAGARCRCGIRVRRYAPEAVGR